CRPRLATPLPDPSEQRLINPSAIGFTGAVWVLDQRGAVGDDGVVGRVPVTTELERDLVHGATVTADLFGHPRPRPIRDPEPRCGDRRMLTATNPSGTTTPGSSNDACARSAAPAGRTRPGRTKRRERPV